MKKHQIVSTLRAGDGKRLKPRVAVLPTKCDVEEDDWMTVDEARALAKAIIRVADGIADRAAELRKKGYR